MSTPKRTQRSSNLNSSPKKVPRATELQDAKVITRTSRGVKDRSIHAYELPFCNDGSGYGEIFEGKMGALHLEHNFPNVFFLFLSSLKEYSKFRNSTESTFPEKWQDLCSALKICHRLRFASLCIDLHCFEKCDMLRFACLCIALHCLE